MGEEAALLPAACWTCCSAANSVAALPLLLRSLCFSTASAFALPHLLLSTLPAAFGY